MSERNTVPQRVCVFSEASERGAEATELAARLGLEVRVDLEGWLGFALVVADDRLELRDTGPGAPGPVSADFGVRRRPGGSDLLKRALGTRRPGSRDEIAIDATAGLGGDSFALAEYGYHVFAVERSPVVAALLTDGLDRARSAGVGPAGRIEVCQGDGRTLIPRLPRADVVLLDPMFPSSGKSALKTKAMRAFRFIVGNDDDAAELLAVARACAGRRVIVKRPRTGKALPGGKPTGSLKGTTVRYDLYPPLPKRS